MFLILVTIKLGKPLIDLPTSQISALKAGPIYELKKDGNSLVYHMYANVRGSGHYRVMYTIDPPAPPPRWDCKVIIHEVRMIDEPGDTPDYYMRLTIQGNQKVTSVKANSRIVDSTSGWRHIYNAFGSIVDLKLELLDSDDGGDDHCDINPLRSNKFLEFRYDRSSGLISGDVSGRMGEILTVTGGGDNNRARLRFSLDLDESPR